MVITYEGVGFIKIEHGKTTVACGPISKQSKFKGATFGSDLALVSVNHEDSNGVDSVSRKEKEPFVIDGPGEYEVSGLFVRGFASTTGYGGSERINTVYTFEIDGMRIAYFGALADTDLPAEVKEGLGDIDILFVPIGGDGILTASEAYKFATKREPKAIIPIYYGEVGDKDALKTFLKEGGSEGVKAQEKLTLKRKDIEGMKSEILVLK